MAHTDKISVPIADAKPIQKITGGAVPLKIAPSIAGMIRTPITNVNDPRINLTQVFDSH